MAFRVLALLLLFSQALVHALPAEESQNTLKTSGQTSNQVNLPAHKLEQNTNGNIQYSSSTFKPDPSLKPVNPIPQGLPQPATPQQANGQTSAAGAHRQGRIFFPFNGFTSGLTGNPSLSSVLTLNLNNLAMVGLFLIGVFILLPSIVGFLTGLTGGGGPAYAAKSLRADDQSSYMWTIMQTLDSALSKNNIDVRVCLERAACHVAKNSFEKAKQGTSSTMESVLNYAISSSYGQTLLSSYRLKEASDRGKTGQDCDSLYNKCPYSLNNLSKLISTYYSIGGAFAPSVPPKPTNNSVPQ